MNFHYGPSTALIQVAMESPIGSKLFCYEYAPSRCPNSWEDINKILLIILGLHFGDLRDFLKFLGRTPRGDASQEIDLAAHQCSFIRAVASINSHFDHTAMIKYEEANGYTILGIYVEFFVTMLENEFKVEGVYKAPLLVIQKIYISNCETSLHRFPALLTDAQITISGYSGSEKHKLPFSGYKATETSYSEC